MRVCIAQINYNSGNIQGHVERIKGIIETYRKDALIVFPELILHGHPSFERPEGLLYRKMKVVYGYLSEDLYRFVKKLDARVIIGESRRKGDGYYNAATYIDGRGPQSYLKTHVHWTESFVPGNTLKVFETPLGKVGINICFDAAFSEVWRTLALRGAEMIVNISAVPRAFAVDTMWRRMTGAAIFNQVFVVYANRPGPYFAGHSALFDPRGEIIASAGQEESIFESDIRLEEVRAWRAEEQVFQNRRPMLYREIVSRHPPPRRGRGDLHDFSPIEAPRKVSGNEG